jgi:hypothetical protein
MPFIGNKPTAVPLTSADIADSIITSAKIVDGTIALVDLSATGTQDATTFLRGDNSFATVSSYTNSDALTLFNATGSAPVYACRAWVNFDGTGTPAIREDGNVTSITDNGTGYYSVNFTTAMPDVNYCVVADSGIGGYRANTDIVGSGNQTVSSSQVITTSTEDATVRDAQIVCLAVFR